jgi:hypothetical protein
VAKKHEDESPAVFRDGKSLLQQIPDGRTAHGLNLGIQLSLNSIELILYVWVTRGQFAKVCKYLQRLSWLILRKEETRRLGSEHDANTPDDSRDDLQSCWKLPL